MSIQQNGRREFEIGDHIWIPCTVENGTFPSERFIQIPYDLATWDGIVDQAVLSESETGETYVQCVILDIIDNEILAAVPGQAHRSGLAKALIEKVRPIDSVTP